MPEIAPAGPVRLSTRERLSRTCEDCGRRRANYTFPTATAFICNACWDRKDRAAAIQARTALNATVAESRPETLHLSSTFLRTDYIELLKQQGGVCAICLGTNANGRRLFVDHNHATGQVRGLLCSHCNSMIGMAREDTQALVAAVAYLIKWNS